jgi:predicted transcriptional regulator of viral defense system
LEAKSRVAAVSEKIAPRELADHLLAHGRPVVTLPDVAELLGTSAKQATSALVRLRRSGRIFSPRPGLYVAVEPQYHTWGSPPALDFIDPMMNAAGRGYYVALLSAAELHGAAHQRPQVFQVMVDQRLPERDFGRVKLRFHQARRVSHRPTQLVNTATGQAHVATPEVTVLDLVSNPHAGGGMGNVATVVAELIEDEMVDSDRLVGAAATYPITTLRRTGWLLDHLAEEYGAEVDTDRLHRALLERSRSTHARVPVAADLPRRGHANKRWGVVENTEIEADL